MRTQEITAKGILIASKLPDTDYVVNPYIGCAFGCKYCYASFMGRFIGKSVQEWGHYTYVKTNAAMLLEKELRALGPKKRNSRVLLSSVTDPYQYAEKKHEVTRALLKAFVADRYPGLVSILTKSSLVTRDIDLLKSLSSCEVGLTITTTDDVVCRNLEPCAPLASARLAALRALNEAGLRTYAFVGPILPHFYHRPNLIERLFAEIADTGVRSVFVEHINLKGYIRSRLSSVLKSETSESSDVYSTSCEEDVRIGLDTIINDSVRRHGLSLRLGQVLAH